MGSCNTCNDYSCSAKERKPGEGDEEFEERRKLQETLCRIRHKSGFVCPHCGETTPILRSGGGEKLALDMGVPFLGSIPLDPSVAESGDSGRALLQQETTSATAEALRKIVAPIEALAMR
ncbi:MAG: P-loop NTPase [Deltaproteobacteria bacterium]|nr:P-loop NTPase [Deltaproteobacteria bacterium]